MTAVRAQRDREGGFTLEEAGLSETIAADLRRSLASFASGWDDSSLNGYNAL